MNKYVFYYLHSYDPDIYILCFSVPLLFICHVYKLPLPFLWKDKYKEVPCPSGINFTSLVQSFGSQILLNFSPKHHIFAARTVLLYLRLETKLNSETFYFLSRQ